MVRAGDNLASGFLGPVKGWRSLVPDAASAVQLPRDLGAWRDRGSAQVYDLVEVRAFTETMGRPEEAFAAFADGLRDGGALLLDVDNLQSPRMLRVVVEGRPGSFDPVGSPRDPSQPLLLRRALSAAAAAGLLVRDVLSVPSGVEEFSPELSASLFRAGLMPVDWLGGQPAARFWLHCEKTRALAGSALIAGDDEAARARTEAALRAFLPDDWEVVTADAVGERAQWNRGVAASRGDVLWFLRAGSQPTAADFAAMSARAGVGVVKPTPRGDSAGDLAGAMMPRLDALFVGPICEQTRNTPVALEDYAMRLDSKLPPAWSVDTALRAPSAPIEAPEQFAADTQALVDRWSGLGPARDEAPSPATSSPSSAPPPAPWVGRAPRVTLCMIARDEERFLEECLRRAQGAFDELVLVDTGSTDRTVEIATSFGAKVVREPWQDDFAAPRNRGLREATGDWVLVLDADEFLLDGSCARIRELVEDPGALAYHLRFTNVYTGGKTLGVMMVRLFRNLPGIAYENVIHEQVTPSLQAIGGPLGLRMLSADVEVEHHGYTDQVMADRNKNERNERLFVKQLERCPDDVYGHYKYGDFLRRVPGRSADARRLLDRCMELILDASPTAPRSLPYAGEVAALCALEAERAGDGARARDVVETALRRFTPTPNLHYLAASLALVDGDAEVAVQHYRRCLAYRDTVLVVPIQDGITSYVSLTGIAQAWLLRGDRARAQRMLEQAIAIEPAYEVAHLILSRLHVEGGDVPRALRVLSAFLEAHPDSPGACHQTTLLLHQLGRDDAARQMGQHTVRLLEERHLVDEAAAVNELLAGI
ncbi:MAG: glycosyltransferase [Planctomycetota bacterium]